MADVKLLRKLPSLYDVSSPLLSKSWSNYPDIFSTGNHIYFVRIIHSKRILQPRSALPPTTNHCLSIHC